MSGKNTDFLDRKVFLVKGISHAEVFKSLSSHTNGLHSKGVTAQIDIGCLFAWQQEVILHVVFSLYLGVFKKISIC